MAKRIGHLWCYARTLSAQKRISLLLLHGLTVRLLWYQFSDEGDADRLDTNTFLGENLNEMHSETNRERECIYIVAPTPLLRCLHPLSITKANRWPGESVNVLHSTSWLVDQL